MAPRDIALALIAVVIWGLNFVAIKWGVDALPPLFLSGARYIVALIPAIFLVRPPKVALWVLIGFGLAIGVGQFGLLFTAIHIGMPAGLASLILQMQAFFTLALGVVVLKDRPRLQQVVGGILALAGLFVIGQGLVAGTALLPLLMTVVAALFWAIANIITKRAGKIDMLAFVVWSSLVPPLPLFTLSLLIEGPAAIGQGLSQFDLKLALVLAFTGYGATLTGYALWNGLLSRYPASTVAPFSLLVPVVGIVSAYLLLGEPMSLSEVAGSVLIFLGLLLNVARFKRLQPV